MGSSALTGGECSRRLEERVARVLPSAVQYAQIRCGDFSVPVSFVIPSADDPLVIVFCVCIDDYVDYVERARPKEVFVEGASIEEYVAYLVVHNLYLIKCTNKPVACFVVFSSEKRRLDKQQIVAILESYCEGVFLDHELGELSNAVKRALEDPSFEVIVYRMGRRALPEGLERKEAIAYKVPLRKREGEGFQR